ncbi:MAG: hypothetical protein Q7T55_19920, partial [Solirubrobacteraceae bacterium]|nr:hypothetical protein [Solirubrobacteraceae bacterium]
VFCWYWSSVPGQVDWTLGIVALGAVSYLLMQGALYWHLKLRALDDGNTLPVWFGKLFRTFKLSNQCVLAAAGAAFGAQIGIHGWRTTYAWPLGLLAFAMLEHINYYHYQLMYDTGNALQYLVRHRRLRRAALGTDLQRALPA